MQDSPVWTNELRDVSADRIEHAERAYVAAMISDKYQDDQAFRDALAGLERGDFTRLDPLFAEDHSLPDGRCRILRWYEDSRFDAEPKALAEALTCACFTGRTDVAAYLLDRGVDPLAGDGTGMNGFHWAANPRKPVTVHLL